MYFSHVAYQEHARRESYELGISVLVTFKIDI